jgi:hypothetical protein
MVGPLSEQFSLMAKTQKMITMARRRLLDINLQHPAISNTQPRHKKTNNHD